VEFSKKKIKNSICSELPKNSIFSKKTVQGFRGLKTEKALFRRKIWRMIFPFHTKFGG